MNKRECQKNPEQIEQIKIHYTRTKEITFPLIVSAFWQSQQRRSHQNSSCPLLGIEAGTLLKAGSDEPKCWWASLEKIAENDYNLAAGRYKPQVVEPVPDHDPTESIQEVLVIEKGIMSGLEKLLQ